MDGRNCPEAQEALSEVAKLRIQFKDHASFCQERYDRVKWMSRSIIAITVGFLGAVATIAAAVLFV